LEREKYRGCDEDNTKLIEMWDVIRISQERLDEIRLKKEEILMDQLSVSSRRGSSPHNEAE
jgi:hypothetical protein